ncbi:MAG: hypothetical protein HPY83_15700 [Anaerolineae bacterium]|nr:hypothetical protein [Anaerolineae bacterium]
MSSDVEAKRRLNSRLETIGWGLFLIMLGGLGLVPDERVPSGTWLLGVGLILLGLNAARYYYGIKTSGFTIVLGILALGSGLGDFVGVDLPWFPIILILAGAALLYRTLLSGRRGGT